MKKKITALAALLLLALPLSLAGCNDGGEPGGGSSEPEYVWTEGAGTLVDLSAMPDGTADNYAYLYEQYPLAVDDDYFGTYGGRDYQGQPDSVLLDNGNILTVFPKGHGRGETVMMISTDQGKTYTDIFSASNPKPASFYNTQETPTIYKLNFTDGTQKLITISARPGWVSSGRNGEGWDAAISASLDENGNCDGLVWSEHENFFGPNAVREEYYREKGDDYDAIVAMSSLTQLKDENGNYIDKWMATFHDYDFYVYKTFLTFNEDAQMEWSEPVRLLGQNGEYRQEEVNNGFCEAEVLRSPDGNELAILFRVNAKLSYSYVSFSTDEGETWSEPQTVSAELTGERHKAAYDPVTGKLVITMRNINYGDRKPSSGWSDSRPDASRGWVVWIGDYEDLKKGEDGHGDMLVKLAHTYGTDGTEITEYANADTGYAGLVVYDNGLFVAASYGTFSPADDPALGGKTYVTAKQFTVSDIAAMAGVTLRPAQK